MKKILLLSVLLLSVISCSTDEQEVIAKVSDCNCERVDETFISGDLIASYTFPNVTNDCSKDGQVTNGEYTQNGIHYTTKSTFHCTPNN